MRCDRCREKILPGQKTCPHCGCDLTAGDRKEYYGRDSRRGTGSMGVIILWTISGLMIFGGLGYLYYRTHWPSTGDPGTTSATVAASTEERATESTGQTEAITRASTESTERITTEQPSTDQTEPETKEADGGSVSDDEVFLKMAMEEGQRARDVEVGTKIGKAMDNLLANGTAKQKKRLSGLTEAVVLSEGMDATLRKLIIDGSGLDGIPDPEYKGAAASAYAVRVSQDGQAMVYIGTELFSEKWQVYPSPCNLYQEQ